MGSRGKYVSLRCCSEEREGSCTSESRSQSFWKQSAVSCGLREHCQPKGGAEQGRLRGFDLDVCHCENLVRVDHSTHYCI